MSHTNTYDATKPLDTELEGKGDDYIKKALLDILERLQLDHNMDGILDTLLATADGYHKRVTLKTLTSDPALLSTSFTVTMTLATPCVITKSAHGLSTGDAIILSTTGALYTGLTAGVAYYVYKIDADTFSLCTTYADAIAGTNKIATSGTQSGTHTCTKPLNGVMYAKSDGLYYRNAAGIVKVI